MRVGRKLHVQDDVAEGDVINVLPDAAVCVARHRLVKVPARDPLNAEDDVVRDMPRASEHFWAVRVMRRASASQNVAWIVPRS